VLDVTVSTDDGQVVVAAAGDLDVITAGLLREALARAVSLAASRPIVVDLAGVRFMDSSGVQALLDGYHSAMVAGGTLTVRGVAGTVERVLDVVGLKKLFGVPPREGLAG
jgi:anti-anti-sigma factor